MVEVLSADRIERVFGEGNSENGTKAMFVEFRNGVFPVFPLRYLAVFRLSTDFGELTP